MGRGRASFQPSSIFHHKWRHLYVEMIFAVVGKQFSNVIIAELFYIILEMGTKHVPME